MSNEKIQSIIVLRAFAFLGIFLLHAGCPVHWSNFGVSIFFVLSGFLLAYRHPKSEFGGGIGFAISHIQKVYPLHVLTMCMAAVISLVAIMIDHTNVIANLVKLGIKVFLNLTLLQSWYPSVRINVSLNGVAWFLSSIFFCYCIFPPVMSIIRKAQDKKKILMAGTIVIIQLISTAILLKFNLDDDVFRWATYDAPFFRVGDFIVGMITGDMYCLYNTKLSSNNAFKKWVKLLIIVVASIGIAVNVWDVMIEHYSYASRVLTNWTTIYIPLSVLLIILLTYEKSFLAKNRVLTYIGKNSNYFFLIHYVVIMYVNRVLKVIGISGDNVWVITLVLSAIITVVFTELYKRLVEKKVFTKK